MWRSLAAQTPAHRDTFPAVCGDLMLLREMATEGVALHVTPKEGGPGAPQAFRCLFLLPACQVGTSHLPRAGGAWRAPWEPSARQLPGGSAEWGRPSSKPPLLSWL